MAMTPVPNKDPLIPRGDYSPVVRERINRLKQDADRLFSLGMIRKRCQQALVQFYTNLKPEPYADLRAQLSNNREFRFAQSLTLTYRSTNDRLIQWAKGCMNEYLLQEALEERERWIEDFARMKIARRWYQMKDDDEAWRVFSQNIPYDDVEREGEIKEFFETLDILSILTDVINGHAEEYGLDVDYEHMAESPEAVQEEPHQDKVVNAIHELTDVVKESLKEPKVQNIYGDKNEFQDGAQLLKMGIPEGADPAEIAARIAEQQRALLEQKKQKK